VTDVAPKEKTTPGGRVALLLAQLSAEAGVQASALGHCELAMKAAGIDWRDIGNLVTNAFKRMEMDADAGMSLGDICNLIEHGYTTKETLRYAEEYAEGKRAEGVEAGIKIGLARANAGLIHGNGHSGGGFLLPSAAEMTAYCHAHFNQLGNEWTRNFITAMVARMKRMSSKQLSPKQIVNLGKIYVELGGGVV